MHNYILGPSEIFMLFFIMLGPLKILIPFLHATKGLTKKEIQALSLKATIFGFFAILIGTFIGAKLLEKWNIQPAVLALTAGFIFLITAILLILHLSHPTLAPTANPTPKATDIVYNMIVTPYGMSAMIIFLALSDDTQRTLEIIGIFGAVMLMNLVCMMFIQQLMGKAGLLVMQLLGAVLGVLQAGLAMSMIFKALRMMKDLW